MKYISGLLVGLFLWCCMWVGVMFSYSQGPIGCWLRHIYYAHINPVAISVDFMDHETNGYWSSSAKDLVKSTIYASETNSYPGWTRIVTHHRDQGLTWSNEEWISAKTNDSFSRTTWGAGDLLLTNWPEILVETNYWLDTNNGAIIYRSDGTNIMYGPFLMTNSLFLTNMVTTSPLTYRWTDLETDWGCLLVSRPGEVMSNIEFGLRSDGVVVWRERK